MTLQMEHLINCFNQAKALNKKYVAIILLMDGFDGEEIIINPLENFDTKLAYYQNTYDNELNHKFAKGIRIIAFTYGDTFSEIENDSVI
ncbi:hypothetical protein [Sutcliffiella horikoshii]|uniref:hypothetical protein n=1 Tax=Sutcliffiella horikoshii TaxID=79883 RepID=UPI003CEA3DC1